VYDNAGDGERCNFACIGGKLVFFSLLSAKYKLYLNSIELPVPSPHCVQYTLGTTIENIGTGILCVYNLCHYIMPAAITSLHINYKMNQSTRWLMNF